MKKIGILLAVVLAAIESVQCRVTPEAGRCHPICVDPQPIDFIGLAFRGKYDMLYATNFHLYRELLDEQRTVTPVSDGVFRVDDLRIFPNGTDNLYTFTVSYIDNIVVEETVDEDGVRHQFRIIPLATTKEDGILYYRCSDTGSPNIDTRVILIPKGNTLSKEGLDYLTAVDAKCNFKGQLKKIPKGLRN